jgi:hypothetical protein
VLAGLLVIGTTVVPFAVLFTWFKLLLELLLLLANPKLLLANPKLLLALAPAMGRLGSIL